MDAMRMNQGNVSQCPIVEEEPNADATRFFDMLKDSNEPLWDDCKNYNKLLAVAQVFTIKSDHELSEAGYDKIIEWTRSILPEGNRLKENFYVAKSMMKPLGLGYQKIDMCPNFCMLYYFENAELTECMTCVHSCYKPRIGRERLSWHIKNLDTSQSHLDCRGYSCHQGLLSTWHDVVDGVMVHPSDSEAWKHFNSVHPHFSAESRNVRLGLCTDKFNPLGSFVAPYSCWLIILTFITCHRGCVWDRSSCFYLLSYPV